MVDRADIRASIQANLEGCETYDDGDLVTDFIVVAVVQNYESGDEAIYFTDSAPPGKTLPPYKAKGLLVDALDIIRRHEASEPE